MTTKITFHEIHSVPVVSTGYVTEHDMDLLENCDEQGNPMTCYPYEFGVFVHVNYDETPEIWSNAMIEHGYSQRMVDLYMAARSQGHQFLRLDADGGDVTGVEHLEW